MAEMRLQKFLARAGVASRRHAEELIAAGRVTVNGARVTEMGVKVDPAADMVAVDGAPVALPEENATFLLHKPAGYVTTMSDPQGRPTVAALMADELLAHPGLFPVGRLDTDTTGLLLFTDDGQLAHQVIAARGHVAKYYRILLARPWEDVYADAIAAGIRLADGAQCKPAQAAPVPETQREALICLHEGKYHQVRRMFAALGNHVEELERVALGGLTMPPDLPLGGCIQLFEQDVQKMLHSETVFSSLLQTKKESSS